MWPDDIIERAAACQSKWTTETFYGQSVHSAIDNSVGRKEFNIGMSFRAYLRLLRHTRPAA